MANQFGQRIQELRRSSGLLQRQVASLLEIDTPLLSKIERGERKIKKAQVNELARIFKTNKEDLVTIWLADQLLQIVEGEELAEVALKVVLKQIRKTN